MVNKYKQRQKILTNADPGLLALAYAVSITEELREKKIGNKIAKYQQLFRQRSGYISDFTLISPDKNLADFRGFNLTKNKRNWLIIIMIVLRLESVF